MIWHQFSEGAPQRGLFVAPRKHRRAKKRALIFPAFLPLIILSSILSQTVLLPAALAAPLASYSAPGHNTFQQFQQGQQNKANQSQFQRPGVTPGMLKPNINTSTNKPLPSAEPAKMHDLTFVLDDSFVLHRPAMKPGSQPGIVEGTTVPIGTTPLMAKGSDGRLEVQVPRGSLDFAHAALADGSAPVGQLILQIHQIAGHFIETDSILGTYQLQIVDSQGHAVQGVQMLHPLTIIYHYQPWEMQDLNIDPGQVRLSWSSLLAPVQTAKQSAGTVQAGSATTQSSAGLVVPMTNNAAAQTLTAQTSVINGIIAASATPEIQAPGKPDLFETSGNSGQYSYSYPLSVVPGPAGFMPQLALSYSSQSPNDRHSRRASAGDEGDGWSLGLGSITVQSYPSSSTGGAATWFFLNGVDGISDRLIPIPGKTGYYDTQHISHLSIQWNGDHWRIFAKDGTYFELGKTSDSQQKTASGVYEWDLDKILAPFNSTSQVKTMFIKYHQDSPDGGTTIRDAGIKQIQYGYATSNTATSLSLIAGTVDFHYHAPNNSSTKDGLGNLYAVAYGTNYNCASSPPSSTTLRCDNPTQSGSVAAPSVMSTMTLDSITSYIGADSANQPAYRYDFAYQDTPFTTNYTDPISKTQETASGEHLLIQITPTIYTQGAPDTRKSLVLGYTGPLSDSYYDPKQNFTGQTSWNYLNHYENLQTGEGATISYATAYGNMVGTPYTTDGQGNVTDDRFDPLYCTNNANNSDTSKRCTGVYAHPETDNWGLQVVTQISALGTDSSGISTVATATYHYALTAIPSSQTPVSSCNPITGTGVPTQEADCVADNWSPGYNGTQTPQPDADWQDYYHAEYRGFNIVYTTSASNDLTVDYYFTMGGWWVGDSGGMTYNGGQSYQEDVYQGDVAMPGALLRETLNFYTGTNVPAGNLYPHNSCHGLENPVYPGCVVAMVETKTTFFERNTANAPWIDTQYTYDDLPTSGGVASGYHNETQEVISSSNAPATTKKWQYVTTDQTDSSSGSQNYYIVDTVSHSEIDDASGHIWDCTYNLYDEGEPSGMPSPAAGLLTKAQTYASSDCSAQATPLTRDYTGYDQYGNVVATADSVATANKPIYASVGCTLATGPVYMPSSWPNTRYTTCTTYDTTHTANLPVTQANALGQTTSTSYDYTSGAVPSSVTDANGQVTSFGISYSGSNETINLSQPGETGSYNYQAK